MQAREGGVCVCVCVRVRSSPGCPHLAHGFKEGREERRGEGKEVGLTWKGKVTRISG